MVKQVLMFTVERNREQVVLMQLDLLLIQSPKIIKAILWLRISTLILLLMKALSQKVVCMATNILLLVWNLLISKPCLASERVLIQGIEVIKWNQTVTKMIRSIEIISFLSLKTLFKFLLTQLEIKNNSSETQGKINFFQDHPKLLLIALTTE